MAIAWVLGIFVAIIFYHIVRFGMGFLDAFLPAWITAPLFGLVLFWFIELMMRSIFEKERELLYDLSDDINEIKRKLGLRTENRTQRQRDEANRRYIQEEANEGRTFEDFKKEWGFWEFHRNKGWIKYYTDEYKKTHPKKTICPKCHKFDNENENGVCVDCEIKVVSSGESNKE
ncbi:MAG: hypothetical protein WC559_04685 [Candidatus Omnitrophota bacterium]